jgi:hypothetical protein
MTRADRILIALLAAVALLALPATRLVAAAATGGDVVVTGPGGTSVLPPRPDRTFMVDGLRGPIELEIKGGAARVVFSPCPDHLCVRQGLVSGPGAALVCVPGGVSVRLGGGDPRALDAVVR